MLKNKMDTRKKELNELIPKDVKIVLDIGSDNNLFDKYKPKTLDVKDADIIQDLNKTQKLSLKNDSVDIVVLSQILEHLVTVEEIVSESKRVAKKYILVGLPNEVTIDNRIRFLLGKPSRFPEGSYCPYGHKHFFNIKEIEDFIIRFFNKDYKKKISYLELQEGDSSIQKLEKNWQMGFLLFLHHRFITYLE